MPKKTTEKAKKPGVRRAIRGGDFGQGAEVRAGIYARVSAAHQQTIPMQLRTLREFAARRGWKITMTVQEVKSGAKQRPERERIMQAARRREIDAVLVWRLDRWGRSMADLVSTLHELGELGVAFVSLNEAFDLTTPTGRAMAAMVAVFAQFEREIRRERVMAGIEQARRDGKRLGRPRSASLMADDVRRLVKAGESPSAIARRLDISRTSVRRIVAVPVA